MIKVNITDEGKVVVSISSFKGEGYYVHGEPLSVELDHDETNKLLNDITVAQSDAKELLKVNKAKQNIIRNYNGSGKVVVDKK